MLPVDPANREVVYSEPGAVPKALGEVDVVFPVLHGPYGEDGTLQGLLELSGVPVRRRGRARLRRRPGQGVHEAGVHLLRAAGRPVRGDPPPRVGAGPSRRPQEDRRLRRRARLAALREARPRRAPPSASPRSTTSPASTRRSRRPSATTRRSSSRRCCAAARSSAGCWSSRTARGPACPPRSRRSPRTTSTTSRPSTSTRPPGIVPAPLTAEQTAEVQRLAVDAFEAASCEGLVRADFFLTEDGEFVINEINTMPGFTPISMYPRMWQESGVELPGAGRPADPGGAAPLHRPALSRGRGRPRPARRTRSGRGTDEPVGDRSS